MGILGNYDNLSKNSLDIGFPSDNDTNSMSFFSGLTRSITTVSTSRSFISMKKLDTDSLYIDDD